jgi:outer membrane protein TolC
MIKSILFFGSYVVVFTSLAQEVLGKKEAIEMVLNQNFDLKIANQNIEIAENNTELLNTGYLPTLTGNAGLSYNTDNISVEFQDGNQSTLNGAESNSRNANLALNWTVFDGFNRKYNIRRNRENLNVSQINAQATLEQVLLDLFTGYYEVARNQQALESLKETLRISKDRLTRTRYGFEYGQNTSLDVSTAEVDVNTDSINYLNAQQLLSNSVRNLNFILAQDPNTYFEVDTAVRFDEFIDKGSLIADLMSNNIQIQQARAGIKVSTYDVKLNYARLLPTVFLNGGFNYRLGNNNRAAFTASNQSTGTTYGASLSWNIFDGGNAQTSIENARINVGIQETLLKQTTQQVTVNFENAWSDFQNKLFIVKAQESNLETNQLNFARTEEQYRLGRVTSLDFRNAQRNLLLAEINLIQAKYDAKLAELLIYQLSGNIQDADF